MNTQRSCTAAATVARLFLAWALLTVVVPAQAAIAAGDTATNTVYLSGTDKDHTVPWDFFCTSGRNSGKWTTIPVPSNWETKGFGTYSKGFTPAPGEKGMYRVTFAPPAQWKGKNVVLVFEGAMTDTEVRINGNSVGPIHQGGFYRFKYDVSTALRWNQPNLLEVTVTKDSADTSVNRAERLGDYWAFAGIYRPVYLEARPAQNIERVAVNAQASGTIAADVFLQGVTDADTITAQVQTLTGKSVGKSWETPLTVKQGKQTITATLDSPLLWTAETPNQYQVQIGLRRGKQVVHQITQKFGFRTIEVRLGDGIYVNGQKVVLKGAPRHSFWPDSARTTSPEISRNDVLLMKQMNMNAVLCAHYPPDSHFLDACDTLGLYVLDELAGWQKKYDTGVGSKLVEEMVTWDVNHPSILFWCNGNEGGWNTALDNQYDLYDPQKRKILHPWALMSGIQTDHYENYESTRQYVNGLKGNNIFMPTEFLHGLYDGGAGAGLNDYWGVMMSRPLGAGGFIWALLDEGLVRDDQNGKIDVTGNNYPDGIVGPYRQKEGSFFTIKDIWAPVQITDRIPFEAAFPANFAGDIALTNTYAFTNTKSCKFEWQLIRFAAPFASPAGHTVLARGGATSPSIAPGGKGTLSLRLPGNWRTADALLLTASDPSGKEINTWVSPIKKAADMKARIVPAMPAKGAVTETEDAASLTLSANGTEAVISKTTGMLVSVRHNGVSIGLANGPALASGTATFSGIAHAAEGSGPSAAQTVTATFSGNLTSVRWRMDSAGWLQLDYRYNLSGPQDMMGVSFSYPEKQVAGIKWLGQGPYHVWKNRMRGPTLDVWQKKYNDTATGTDAGTDLWNYPEWKGYYAKTYWAQLQTTEGAITMVTPDENLFLRLYTPRNGPGAGFAVAPFPSGDISFMDGIPAMGSKFAKAAESGPEGQPNTATGDYQHTVFFYFGAGPGAAH